MLHWPRKNHITDYDILLFSLRTDMSELTEAEAARYFQDFLAAIPQRSQYLMRHVTGGSQSELLTYQPESLIPVWKWFLQKAELVRDEQSGNRMLSLVTEYIIRDIGMYFGALWVTNHPGLSWGHYS